MDDSDQHRHPLILISLCYALFGYMSLVLRKPAFCICENKDADQLHGNREADQCLCFRYTDSRIPLLPNQKVQASSYLLWLYSPANVGPGRKHRRPVFLQRGSYEDSSFHYGGDLSYNNSHFQLPSQNM